MAKTEQSDKKRLAHTKVTRDDWLRAARTILIEQGIERVKVQPLAQALSVSRSSFYWYFRDRDELLQALLSRWRDTNTRAILDHAARPAPGIFQAINNVFECWIDESLFDPRLDFAVREWARRSMDVREVVDEADNLRVTAISEMFEAHDYPPKEAFIRARVLYFMQIGYYALELGESVETRMNYIGGYLESFSGKTPNSDEVDDAIVQLATRAGVIPPRRSS